MKLKNLLALSLIINFVLIITLTSAIYYYRDKLLQKFVEKKGNMQIVMYGNSITAQGKWVELLRRTDVLNSGLPGRCTYHLIQEIENQVIKHKPKVCFLMAGINDIQVGVSSEILETNYQRLLDKLLASQIQPIVNLTVYEHQNPASMSRIDSLNSFLIKYCTLNQIRYIDLNAKLCDSTGLKSEYAADQTHLNGRAYKIWGAELRTVLKDLKL